MGKCSVPLCKGRPTFTFPKDEKRRVRWEKAINANFRSSKTSRLCSHHFEKDVIIEKNESYYTGVISSKKTLKPNAVPTLNLELGDEKSKNAELIRKSLFEEDSNPSSSLRLSYLDYLPHGSENCCMKTEASSIDAPIENCTSLALSNDRNEVTVVQQGTEYRDLPFQENITDNNTSETFISSPPISESTTISDMLIVSDLHSNIDVQTEETVLLSMPENDGTVRNESTQLKSSEEKQGKSSIGRKATSRSIGTQAARGFLSVHSICLRDDVIHYYTGLGTYAKFSFVYGTLSDYVDHIKYVKGQVNCMEPEDMFLLTLMKLRRNIPDFGLSFHFGISEAIVRNIFNTWVHYIYQLWSLLDTWPSREVVDFYMPEGFKKLYPSTRVIVDATEIPIDKPSNPIAQQATFSTYKNKNTVKILVGGSPDGILCYHSPAYGGSTSDRQIVERSNLVQKCLKGDSVMADRGFNVQDIFQSQGVTVNMPHFLKDLKRRTNSSDPVFRLAGENGYFSSAFQPSSKEQSRLRHGSPSPKEQRRQRETPGSYSAISAFRGWRRSTSVGNRSGSTTGGSGSTNAKLPSDPATVRRLEQFPLLLSDTSMPDEDLSLKFLALNALDLTAPASDVLLKNRLKSWFQLSGHPDGFAPAGPGTVWKRRAGGMENTERIVYEALSKDETMRDCVPRYYREVEYKGDTFIELQDLLFGFNDPHVMDIKMGTRTFLESEVSKTTARPDLYQKMVAVDPDAPTIQEHEERAVTKLRYMQFREQQSSTCSHGFRIEAMKLPGAPPITDLKKVKSHCDVLATMAVFLNGRENTRKKLLERLRNLRTKFQESIYFQTHEVIGSSIFMIYDEDKVGVWLIDFAKTYRVSDGQKLTHRLPWDQGNHEEGFLFGLDNLISTIEEVDLFKR